MKRTTQESSREWESPRLRELNLLQDAGVGFSEPPPPSHGDGSGGGRDHRSNGDSSDREAFDWL